MTNKVSRLPLHRFFWIQYFSKVIPFSFYFSPYMSIFMFTMEYLSQIEYLSFLSSFALFRSSCPILSTPLQSYQLLLDLRGTSLSTLRHSFYPIQSIQILSRSKQKHLTPNWTDSYQLFHSSILIHPMSLCEYIHILDQAYECYSDCSGLTYRPNSSCQVFWEVPRIYHRALKQKKKCCFGPRNSKLLRNI